MRTLRRSAVVTIDPSATIGAVELRGRGAPGHLSVGPHSVVEDGAIIHLHEGGTIEIGSHVRIRTGVVLNVEGHLVLEGRNLLSWYTVVHCAESIVFGELAGTGEGVTVVDSGHFHGGEGRPDEHWYHNNRTEPVSIGRNTWLAAKSTVSAGAHLGDRTTVAGHAFVRRGTYPDGATLVGVPARVVENVGERREGT
jgi:acetyltransferase-like isoleucine patch superfamily enzyme